MKHLLWSTNGDISSCRMSDPHDPDASYDPGDRLAIQKGNKEAAFHYPPSSKTQNTSECRKKNHKKSLAYLTDPQIDAPAPQTVQDSPTFHPIIPSRHPHEVYNTSSAGLRHQKAVEPFKILKLFLTPSNLEQRTCNTNTYAVLKTSEYLQGGGRKWKEVSTPESGIWSGL